MIQITPLICLITLLCSQLTTVAQPNETERVVRLIQQRCVKCHGGEIVNGGVDFSNLNDELDVWNHRHTFEKALDMLKREKMPPDTEPKMPGPMRDLIGGWIEHSLNNVDINRIPNDPGFLPPRRLNRNEYNFTVQDLFGINATPADQLPPDQVIGDAFDNDASTLTVEQLWFERALGVAKDTVREVWANSDALEKLLFIEPTPPVIREKALYTTDSRQARKINLSGRDFTVLARVKGTPGHIFTKSPVGAGFTRGAKQLSFASNSISYKVQVGRALNVDTVALDDGNEHRIALRVEDKRASLFLDGRLLVSIADFNKTGGEDNLFKIGMPGSQEREEDSEEEEIDPGTEEAEAEYPGIEELKFFREALPTSAVLEYTAGNDASLPEPSFDWHAGIKTDYPEEISPQQAATEVLDRFLTRAFRRPPTADEMQRYLALFETGSATDFPFDIAMQLPITAALSSPSFLLRTETTQDTNDSYPISSIDMATRLSYFLW
ncbi:MAG: DUF1587 domain-containing protein, partial [Candidatus Hydrogenedentota bacterium]